MSTVFLIFFIRMYLLSIFFDCYSIYSRKYLRLPHASTLRSYVGSVDCEPGFLLKVLDAAALFDEQDRQCNLVIDEMKLKKSSIFDKHRL